MDTKIQSKIIILIILTVIPPAMAQTGAESKDRLLGGELNAPITIEIFSCYQCPPCRDFYLETIRPLLKNYADLNKVCVLYYEFPLKIHKYSRKAARYGESARSLGQDQWRRVSEALFIHLDQWQIDNNIEAFVAQALSQDEMARVGKLIRDPSIDKNINRDIAEGHRRQIKATPTFFVHAKGKTKKIVGPVSYPVLKDYIDRQLR